MLKYRNQPQTELDFHLFQEFDNPLLLQPAKVRSLWTAATGMTAQQTNLDTIANNLANVNSAGYKTEQLQQYTLYFQI